MIRLETTSCNPKLYAQENDNIKLQLSKEIEILTSIQTENLSLFHQAEKCLAIHKT